MTRIKGGKLYINLFNKFYSADVGAGYNPPFPQGFTSDKIPTGLTVDEFLKIKKEIVVEISYGGLPMLLPLTNIDDSDGSYDGGYVLYNIEPNNAKPSMLDFSFDEDGKVYVTGYKDE